MGEFQKGETIYLLSGLLFGSFDEDKERASKNELMYMFRLRNNGAMANVRCEIV